MRDDASLIMLCIHCDLYYGKLLVGNIYVVDALMYEYSSNILRWCMQNLYVFSLTHTKKEHECH